jgi:hypothetical protein
MHPIRTLKAAFAAFLQTFTDLAAAIRANTAATANLAATAERIETAASTTAEATAYIAASEKHLRIQQGQRHDFGGAE